jgi:GH25 family lysozyme M1 (1,4-beta-N-acetylmuramidase)
VSTQSDVDEAAADTERPLYGGSLIDLSATNTGRVDLGAAKESGVCAAYFRGCLGRVTNVHDIDSRVHEYAKKAVDARMPFGAYSLGYARHGMAQDAAAQADNACDLAEELGASLIVSPDWEHEEHDERVSESEFLDAILLWVNRAKERQGKWPLLYTGPGWWSLSKLRLARAELAQCPLWCSDFESSRPIGSPLVPRPWAEATVHQFAGSPTLTGRTGYCAGIDGYVDRSVILGSLNALMR